MMLNHALQPVSVVSSADVGHVVVPAWRSFCLGPDMRYGLFISLAVVTLLSACATSQPVSGPMTFSPITVEPPRDGEILVFIAEGPVTNKGQHWFPEGSTLATVLDWAGLDPVAPPRTIRVIDTAGHSVRCRVEGRPRGELERIKIGHGTRIVVPYDRCFGLGPNKALQATAAAPGSQLVYET